MMDANGIEVFATCAQSSDVDRTEYLRRVADVARWSEEAWRVAVSDAAWHEELSEMGKTLSEDESYWLVPFVNYKTMCTYPVGGYDRVADEIARHVSAGFYTFILDIPPSEDELRHMGAVFQRATQRVPL